MPDWLKTIYSSPAKTLRAFCVVFVASTAFASLGFGASKVALPVLFGGVFLFLSLAVVAVNKKSVRFGFLMVVAILFGVWRFGVGVVGSTCEYSDYFCTMGASNVSIIGTIIEAPSELLGNTQYVVKPNDIGSETPILVLGPKYPKFNFGDTVSIECKLKAPENEPGSTFNYVKYLESRGIGAICNYPKSFELYTKGNYGFYNYILTVKEKLSHQVEKLWPEPASSLMAGIMYGSQSNLPAEIKDEFSVSGLSHIIAVSGFNVSIIAMVLLLLFTRAGFRRRVAVVMALVSIWLFVLMVGASASAVRAGIMASVVLVAELFGRLPDVGGALIYAATVMALENPYIIMWDIGFQLSFVATLGLVYGAPILERVISKEKMENRRVKKLVHVLVPDFLLEVVLTSFAAIIATLPIMLYYFGQLSPLALIANILVVPLIPWLMLAGATAIVMGFLIFPLGYAVAFIANIGLQYVLLVAHVFGKPQFAVQLQLPWWGVVVIYIVGCAYVQRLRARAALTADQDF